MAPTVSIIVPIYNAEKSLERCVDSILAQEFTDFELILLDDGSKDRSGELADRYAARDSRVRTIHRPNSGVSATRNAGLDLATGTYVQFVDSDDWLTSDALRLTVGVAQEKGCDMVITDFYRVMGERVSRKGDIDDDVVLSREEFAERMMTNPADFYYGVLWNKLFRRDIIESHGLRMDPAISWCEDFMFNLEYIRHAESFFALQVPVYYYVATRGSLTFQGLTLSGTIQMKLSVFEYYNQFYKSVLDEEEYQRRRAKVYSFLIDAAQDALVFPGERLGEERVDPEEGPAGEGILHRWLKERRELEHALEPVALKNGLTLTDVLLLFVLLPDGTGEYSGKELAQLLGRPAAEVGLSVTRLRGRDLIRLEGIWELEWRTRRLTFTAQSGAGPILKELTAAFQAWERGRAQ